MDQLKFQTFCECFYEAFEKMMAAIPGLEISSVHAMEEPESKTFSVIVGVVGLNKGRVHLEMTESLGKRIYQCSNGEEAENEMDLCFYLAEFANMVAGKGITVLNNIYKGGNLRLTPPAIFAGDDLNVVTLQVLAASKLYHTQYGTLKIEIGFEGL
jgi:CheY-specific phosphatase CheX